MNWAKLKAAERAFLGRYPNGFDDAALIGLTKRHNLAKHVAFAQEYLTPESGARVAKTLANIELLVSRSSMVSFFEKPKFKGLIARLDRHQQAFFVDSMLELLHGDQPAGFAGLVDVLQQEKLARWSLVTIVPTYFAPSKAVFVKPTTAKGILAALEIEHLVYKPQPTWAFYEGYRDLIEQLKAAVDSRLSPSNAAFTGFLMMALPSVGQ